MKTGMLIVLASFLAAGCSQDPRVPLDTARRDINDIRGFQLQALALRGLQDDLQEAFARDSNVARADVGLHFTSSNGGLAGQRLVVDCVILVELTPNAFAPPKPPPSKPPKVQETPPPPPLDSEIPPGIGSSPATQPAKEPAPEPPAESQNAAAPDYDRCVQDLVRDLLARHKWEIEDVNTYHYGNEWRIVCQLRAAAAPPWAGIGLDILPKRVKGEK